MSRYNQQFSSLIQKIGTRTIINALPDEWKGKRLLLIPDNCEPHLTDEVRDEAQKTIPAFSTSPLTTFAAQPLDVSINKPLKDRLRAEFNKYLVDRQWDGQLFDLITKDLLIEWIVASWNGIDSDTFYHLSVFVGMEETHNQSNQKTFIGGNGIKFKESWTPLRNTKKFS